MNKRGQIYILVALILALVLYMLMTKTNIIYEHEIIDDFETLSRNYDVEASKFMNKLLETPNTNIKDDFDDFTCDFTKYAKNQNPDFSLIYIFEYDGKLYIGNYLKQPIFIGNTIMRTGCKESTRYTGVITGGIGVGGLLSPCRQCVEEIETISPLDITIGSNLYKIEIVMGRPEIIIVSREDKGEQRKVYTKEEFIGEAEEVKARTGSEFCGEEGNTKYTSFCSKKGKVNCGSYDGLKEPCEYDENCCWNEESGECKPEACEKNEKRNK